MQIPDIITDFLILILPLKALGDLSLPKTQVLLVLCILAVGLTTCIFDIIRLTVFLDTRTIPDLTWGQVGIAIWTDLGPSVGILAACLPVMLPLLHPRRALEQRKTRTHKSSNPSDVEPIELQTRESTGQNSERSPKPEDTD